MTKLDPVTMEVLRHRLTSICEEMAQTTIKMSASYSVFEANDFNVAIMDARGDVLAVGLYILRHGSVISTVVKKVLGAYAENPGIGPGDMFLTNDPYWGANHNPDAVLVSPVFWEGELVVWTGVTIHEDDVGGPVPGGWTVGARDMYGEAPRIPAIRIVEGGRVRQDLLNLWKNNSRSPHVLDGNFRARMGACKAGQVRLEACFRAYGQEVVLGFFDQLIAGVGRLLAQRLREIPDGVWESRSYVDTDTTTGAMYQVHLALTKLGERLTFDFTQSADQAPGPINCALASTRGAVEMAVLPLLCWDMPRVPAAIWRCTELRTRPGSVCDAQPPAAVSCSVATGNTVLDICTHAVSNMLASTDKYRHRANAVWRGNFNAPVWRGTDPFGNPYAAFVGLHGECGGMGAWADRDGEGSCGYMGSPRALQSNVELDEMFHPCLFLFWRESTDSGGPGKFRGGLASEFAYFPYKNRSSITAAIQGFDVEVPQSMGVSGGYPGGTHRWLIFRGIKARDLVGQGQMFHSVDELIAFAKQHELPYEVCPPGIVTTLQEGDIQVGLAGGGGGYGDPLDRDPVLVVKDVLSGKISPACARDLYGVPLGPGGAVVDGGETSKLREHLRRLRAGVSTGMASLPRPPSKGRGRRVAESLAVKGKGASRSWACAQCGHVLGPLAQNPKDFALARSFAPLRAGPRCNPWTVTDIELREFYCPDCASLLSVEVARKGDPLLWEARLA